MQKITLLFILFSICYYESQAAILKGKVIDEKGEPLPFASIYLKGTTKGTTTNLDGIYQFEIATGEHIVICQYVGYQKEEINLTIKEEVTTKNFSLKLNNSTLKEITIKSGGNPANAIMKKTIAKRSYYNKEIDAFKANVYIKGNFKLDEVSQSNMLYSLMGGSTKKDDGTKESVKDEVDKMRGIISLSESNTEVAYKRPDKLKIFVKSTRVSGNKGSYGFSDPMFINFYDNNVSIGEQLSPRGFVSPIAETAMLSYKYELLSAYMEDGKLINRIKVIPRRKFEPLFSGIIDIIENEWRLHSVDLQVDKSAQLDVADTVRIKQVFVPVNNILMVKDQSFKIKIKLFGFGITGNYVNVFSDYVFNYDTKNTFNKFVKEYDTAALHQTAAYWETHRPVPLDKEEVADYVKKDSIEKVDKLKADSVKSEKNSFRQILMQGYSKRLKKSASVSSTAVISLSNMNWNTVEGFNYAYGIEYKKRISKDRLFNTKLRMRYGLSNQQFNAKVLLKYTAGKTNKSALSLSGGRYVFQYNNNEPVNDFINSFYTLLEGQNYLKIYQAYFAKAKVNYKYISGLSLTGQAEYQDRTPLWNTNLFSFKKSHTEFTENFPKEISSGYMSPSRALTFTATVSYQPGRKYIKYPDRIRAVESKYPTFSAAYKYGIPVLNHISNVDYSKYELAMWDDMDVNLWGTLKYMITMGGFVHQNNVPFMDYTHFNGNQIILASPYLNSFQLSPYYANSNTEPFYATLNAEHHFYGLLTNKIPLFRRLKWYLVASTNTYYVDKSHNYVEVSAGLENIGYRIFRFLRVDGVAGYTNLKTPVYGIRIGINSSLIQIGSGKDED